VLGLQPGTEAGIVDFGLIVPEAGAQTALDLEMIQLQFDYGDVFRKITANVRCTDVESSEAAALALCFDYHTRLLFNFR
jgi:hypothetical protein